MTRRGTPQSGWRHSAIAAGPQRCYNRVVTRVRCVPAWVVILLAASGCAGGAPNGSPPPLPATDRNLITHAEFTQRRFSTVYAAVESLRPNWPALRGPEG